MTIELDSILCILLLLYSRKLRQKCQPLKKCQKHSKLNIKFVSN